MQFEIYPGGNLSADEQALIDRHSPDRIRYVNNPRDHNHLCDIKYNLKYIQGVISAPMNKRLSIVTAQIKSGT